MTSTQYINYSAIHAQILFAFHSLLSSFLSQVILEASHSGQNNYMISCLVQKQAKLLSAELIYLRLYFKQIHRFFLRKYHIQIML